MFKPFLFIVFYCVLTPLALVCRALGYDPMALKQWGKGKESVFVDRNHTYTSAELKSPR